MTIEVSTEPSLIEPERKPRVDRATYLSNLLNLCQDCLDLPRWLTEVRSHARARVQELAIPSTREEEWRFTDLSALLLIQFAGTSDSSVKVEAPALVPEAKGQQLVFVDGIYQGQLSAIADLPTGLFLGSLTEALQNPGLAAKLQTYFAQQQGAEEVFTALNTANFRDIAVVWIPRNLVLETPIHLLFVSTASGSPQATYPRSWLVAETGSRVTLIEEYVTLGDGITLTNAVTEAWVEENAQLDHTVVQHSNLATFHVAKTAIAQARDSHYNCHAVTDGAKLSRHNLNVFLQGAQTETHLNGLTWIQGDQTADTHSMIVHTQPHGTSRQIHKCIVGDRAHAVFNGKIQVPKVAQLTNAAQLSRNLLLSPKARVDTKPQLEIVADNVKCAHGATVSQLESDEIFYLQSRGLDRKSACQLLVNAFAFEVLEQIPVASVREQLIQRLASKSLR